jgi:D-alanyl-D-alanine-carboxypeptidase/D-alanyl-D-alanine-endopeptidase
MKKITVLLLLVVFIGCTSKGQIKNIHSEKNNLSQETIEKIINEELSEFMKPPYSAVSGAVYVDGRTYQFHSGKLINGEQPNNQTIYEIGSITKTYTGLILSQAVYDKKLSLDIDVRTYLNDEYPNLELDNNKPITLRHLITHTSGLPMNINCNNTEFTIEEQLSCFKNFTKDSFFKALKHTKIIDNSGENYRYSNAGVQLVGYILENVYQMPFQELLKKYVFPRSGERNTIIEINSDINVHLAIGKNSNGKTMPLENGFYEYAGGLKSSTSSMLDYIKMYLENNDTVVKESMSLLAGNVKYGRAFAWNTFDYDQPNKMLYHNGGTFGQSSWIAIYPNQNIGIFLVTNVLTDNSQGNLNELSNKIINRMN